MLYVVPLHHSLAPTSSDLSDRLQRLIPYFHRQLPQTGVTILLYIGNVFGNDLDVSVALTAAKFIVAFVGVALFCAAAAKLLSDRGIRSAAFLRSEILRASSQRTHRGAAALSPLCVLPERLSRLALFCSQKVRKSKY